MYVKNHQFLSSIKTDAHKRKLVPFSASRRSNVQIWSSHWVFVSISVVSAAPSVL